MGLIVMQLKRSSSLWSCWIKQLRYYIVTKGHSGNIIHTYLHSESLFELGFGGPFGAFLIYCFYLFLCLPSSRLSCSYEPSVPPRRKYRTATPIPTPRKNVPPVQPVKVSTPSLAVGQRVRESVCVCVCTFFENQTCCFEKSNLFDKVAWFGLCFYMSCPGLKRDKLSE